MQQRDPAGIELESKPEPETVFEDSSCQPISHRLQENNCILVIAEFTEVDISKLLRVS